MQFLQTFPTKQLSDSKQFCSDTDINLTASGLSRVYIYLVYLHRLPTGRDVKFQFLGNAVQKLILKHLANYVSRSKLQAGDQSNLPAQTGISQ